MHTGGLLAAPLLVLTLAACGSADPGARAVVVAGPSTSAAPTPTAPGHPADLRYVCDHVQEAFRDGTMSPQRQAAGLSAELQGMADVSGRAARRALAPMVRAEDGLSLARGAAQLRRREAGESRAYHRLRQRCRAAGSTAWGA